MVTSVVWFRFSGSGVGVIGPVQGFGGMIASSSEELAVERMSLIRRRARVDRPTGCYEPSPGHVRVYPQYSAHGNGPGVDVDIRSYDLTIEVVRGPWS